jgi:hypothetical protein
MAVPDDHKPALDGGELRVRLESRLPAFLPTGTPSAAFCFGHCFHRRQTVTGLELAVGGTRQAVTAHGMPRRDLHDWLTGPHGGGADPEGRSYRSGFWATVAIPAQVEPGPLAIEAAVTLADGRELVAGLGTIPVLAAAEAADCGPGAEPIALPGPNTIVVCLAAFEPDADLLDGQLDSLRAQTDGDWICVVSDGGSSAAGLARLRAAIGEDRRFVLSHSAGRLDPYRNFERALGLVPPQARLVALCDQDDRWYPDKLATLRAALGDAQLAYSDQRLVSGDGRLLRDSLWTGRRHDDENLISLLVANTAPGAAMLFRRALLDRALPFPVLPGFPFHDHWLALSGRAGGRLAYVDRPLYDYVQHGAAVQGTVAAASAGDGGARSGAAAAGGRSRGWRGAYFGGYVPRQVQAEVLLARGGAGLSGADRRRLRRFAAADRSPGAFLWLALRPLRRLIGRDETLGGELALMRGIVWRALVGPAAGRRRPGRFGGDASFPDPPSYEQRRLRRWRAGNPGVTG